MFFVEPLYHLGPFKIDYESLLEGLVKGSRVLALDKRVEMLWVHTKGKESAAKEDLEMICCNSRRRRVMHFCLHIEDEAGN